MRLVTTGPRDEILASAAPTPTFTRAPLPELPGLLGRAAAVVGDLLALLGIVLCIPIVILAIGMPIALCVRLLLWIGGAH